MNDSLHRWEDAPNKQQMSLCLDLLRKNKEQNSLSEASNGGLEEDVFTPTSWKISQTLTPGNASTGPTIVEEDSAKGIQENVSIPTSWKIPQRSTVSTIEHLSEFSEALKKNS